VVRVYDLHDAEGRFFAFEVDNLRLERGELCDLVRTIPGATVVREPRFLSYWREDEFCEFEVNGQRFKAEEPFGDNSRYWIGPEPPRWCAQLESVRQAFAAYNPSLIPSAFFRRLLRRRREKGERL